MHLGPNLLLVVGGDFSDAVIFFMIYYMLGLAQIRLLP